MNACLHTEQLWNIAGTHGHCKKCGKQFGEGAGGPPMEVKTQPADLTGRWDLRTPEKKAEDTNVPYSPEDPRSFQANRVEPSETLVATPDLTGLFRDGKGVTPEPLTAPRFILQRDDGTWPEDTVSSPTDKQILDAATKEFPDWRIDIQEQFVLRVVRAALEGGVSRTDPLTVHISMPRHEAEELAAELSTLTVYHDRMAQLLGFLKKALT